MIAAIFISIVSFILLVVRAAGREIHLCSALIKQMEATQQAERKSMNKSLAFASASHDIRAALAGITGLIEICYAEVRAGSELDTNLRQMDGCTKDLVGKLIYGLIFLAH
jgi:signal transduction histidine kinase